MPGGLLDGCQESSHILSPIYSSGIPNLFGTRDGFIEDSFSKEGTCGGITDRRRSWRGQEETGGGAQAV